MDHNVITIKQANDIKIIFDDVLNNVNKQIDENIFETMNKVKQTITENIKSEMYNNINKNIFPEMYSKNYRKISEEEYYEHIINTYCNLYHASNIHVNHSKTHITDRIHSNYPKYNNLCDYDEYIIKICNVIRYDSDMHITFFIITNKLKYIVLKVLVQSYNNCDIFSSNYFRVETKIIKTGKYYAPNDYIDIIINFINLLECKLYYKSSNQYTLCVDCLIIPYVLTEIEKCIEKYLKNRIGDSPIDTKNNILINLQRKYQGYNTYHERYKQHIINCKEFEQIKDKFNTESGIKEFEEEKKKLTEMIEHYKSESGLKEFNDAEIAFKKMESNYILRKNKYDRDILEFNKKKEAFEKAKKDFEAQLNDEILEDTHDD